jgi:hypothetical protein
LEDEGRRQWLERVAEAARRAADELRRDDEHYHQRLIRDLDDLHLRMRAQLDEPRS